MSKPEPKQHDEDEDRRADTAIVEALRSRRYIAYQSLPGRTKARSRLLVVPRLGLWEWIDNGALWRMRAKPDGTQIGLSFHSVAVVIEGSGLMNAAFSIDRHNCLFLQEYASERHDSPLKDEAIITSIEFFSRVPDRLAPPGTPDALRH